MKISSSKLLRITLIAFGLLLLNLAYADETIQVLSGGSTDYISGRADPYRATWTWKTGFWQDGAWRVSTTESDHYLFEYQFLQSVASPRWGTFPSALNTLHDDYNYSYMTGDCENNQHFDDIW